MAIPFAALLKKKHVVKRKAKPPIAPETTSVDQQAGIDL
jgi:hypothetical protein